MINAGIVGITGYTGEELLKILSRHAKVRIAALAGRS
jgi:N-acetyl-gamma-glutamyl-phosphate reductase